MAQKFEGMCRLCMKHEERLLPIFTEENTLPVKLSELLPALRICSGDRLPSQVCQHCVQQVDTCYNFLRQCELSDSTYRNYLNNEVGNNVAPLEEKLQDEQVLQTLSEMKADMLTVKIEESNHELDVTIDTSLPEDNKRSYRTRACSVPKEQENDRRFSSEQPLIQCKQAATEPDTEYTCKECRKKFVHKMTYLNHQRLHEIHKCSDCGKMFPTPYTLKLHSRKHTGEKPFVCEVCGKGFSLHHNYKTHKKVHMGLKPFQCPDCNKFFTTKQALQNHLLIHSGEKPYICEICGQNMRDKAGLARHIKSKHEENRMTYNCTMCPKTYTRLLTLKIHMRTHSGERPFQCSICGLAFTQNALLKNHHRVHTGEKKYDCKFCGKKFSTNSSRDRHVRTHTGETPYECDMCHKAFSLRRDLKNHVVKFHGEQELCSLV